MRPHYLPEELVSPQTMHLPLKLISKFKERSKQQHQARMISEEV